MWHQATEIALKFKRVIAAQLLHLSLNFPKKELAGLINVLKIMFEFMSQWLKIEVICMAWKHLISL